MPTISAEKPFQLIGIQHTKGMVERILEESGKRFHRGDSVGIELSPAEVQSIRLILEMLNSRQTVLRNPDRLQALPQKCRAFHQEVAGMLKQMKRDIRDRIGQSYQRKIREQQAFELVKTLLRKRDFSFGLVEGLSTRGFVPVGIGSEMATSTILKARPKEYRRKIAAELAALAPGMVAGSILGMTAGIAGVWFFPTRYDLIQGPFRDKKMSSEILKGRLAGAIIGNAHATPVTNILEEKKFLVERVSITGKAGKILHVPAALRVKMEYFRYNRWKRNKPSRLAAARRRIKEKRRR